jgi:DNA repair exonuclease SbcCD ATPase subunit
MFDDNPEDQLQELEKEMGKLSEIFQNSLFDIRNYSPFVVQEGEKNMENSNDNINRINYENIINYEDNKNNFNQTIENHSNQINNIFNNINNIIENLKKREEFKKTEEDLNKTLNELKEDNKNSTSNIEKKVKYIDDLLKKVKTEYEMEKQIEPENNDISIFDFDSNK